MIDNVWFQDMHFWWSVGLSAFMICLTTTIHYEYLRLVCVIIERVRARPRWLINVVVISQFIAHTITVWAYGILYWLLAEYTDFPTLSGENQHDFLTYIYFSASTYSSLGFGDVYPTGALRMISGVEVLNGLLLIGWSVTFTYLTMQRFWEMHMGKTPDEDKNILGD